MVQRIINIVFILAFLMSHAASGAESQKTGFSTTGCPSVEALAEKIWNAHKTHDVEAILELVDYTGADVGETQKVHIEAIDDRRTANPSAVSFEPIQKAEIEWFRFQGMGFNLEPVVKIRIEYQELRDTEIKKDIGGMLMSLPAILYYYVGQKNERYFIATAVPVDAAPSNHAGSTDRRTSESDMIMAIPTDESGGTSSLSDGNHVLTAESDDTVKAASTSSTENPVQENIFLSGDFWKQATADDVKKAIASGFDIDVDAGSDDIPLILAAAYSQDPDLIDLLLHYGVDVNVRDFFRQTPLMAAAGSNPNLAVADRLVKKGADLKAEDMEGFTALSYAAMDNPNPAMIDWLVGKGLDVKQKSKYGDPILVLAARSNPNPEVIDRLIKHGADIRERDEDDRTPLMAAAQSNPNPAIIDRLIEYGVEIEARSNTGMTALAEAAALNENPQVLERLIGHGADMTAKDNDGHSVLYWAEENRSLRGTQVLFELQQAMDH